MRRVKYGVVVVLSSVVAASASVLWSAPARADSARTMMCSDSMCAIEGGSRDCIEVIGVTCAGEHACHTSQCR